MSLPTGPDDVTVVATIDFNFVPYHWDFLASKMPQALDKDPSNDLPLDLPPDQWLPGFPDPDKAFKSYKRFDLALEEKDPDVPLLALDAKDKAEWDKVKKSTFDEVNYYWMPGTKVIGAVEFGGEKLHGTPQDHGMGVTSVSVGNIHGTCPECLLVFINLDNGDSADAIRWAMDQPWIDVISNSYGRGVAKVYNGPGVTESHDASERGQSVVFSAGNGVENGFTVTNNTYASAEKGPDWMITVGAVSPGKDNPYGQEIGSEHSSFIGAGKPVDVAGLGLSYPSAYGATTVSGTGTSGFSGTSNAAPTIAGTYARALYTARRELKGPSRIQQNGVIAVGAPYKCGSARPKCELKD
ncbi:MAG: S8 family serine peptidase, partial [Actinobacteria bacterium]|nr:S8 family serine peptidase [Actinomycetota bacterium]